MHSVDYYRLKIGDESALEQLITLAHGIIEADIIGRPNVMISPLFGVAISKIVNLEMWQKQLKNQHFDLNLYDTEAFEVKIIQCHYEDIDITDKVLKDGRLALSRRFNCNTLVDADPKPKAAKMLKVWYLVNEIKHYTEIVERDGLLRDIDYFLVPEKVRESSPRVFPIDFYDSAVVYEILSHIPFTVDLSPILGKLTGRWNAVYDPPATVGHPVLYLTKPAEVRENDVVYPADTEYDKLIQWLLLKQCRGTIYIKDSPWGQFLLHTCQAKVVFVKLIEK